MLQEHAVDVAVALPFGNVEEQLEGFGGAWRDVVAELVIGVDQQAVLRPDCDTTSVRS